MHRKLFVNLPVQHLERSKAFFGRLGFEFNPKFTDENAACMLVGEDAYVMLLTVPFFRGFTQRKVGDPRETTQALYALSCDSRAEVDALVQRALDQGATPALEPKDYGFMYQRSFYDLDGHHWEVMWMDPKAAQ
jgi:uncharacterized protein